MKNIEIEEKYNSVKNSLSNAIDTASEIKVAGDEENVELKNILNVLKQLNDEFGKEISTLENSSEWDRFCMAFFGETNAGKSTIIEALRIVYDEELRRAKILEQNGIYVAENKKNTENYRNLIQRVNEIIKELEKQANNRKQQFLGKLALVLLGIIIGFVIAVFVVM